MKITVFAWAFMCIGSVFVVVSPAQGVDGSSLSYIPVDHWSYQAFYRLESLGLIPLNALATRPITRLEAQRLVKEASTRLRQADSVTVRQANEDFLRLSREFSTDSGVVVTLGGVVSNRNAAQVSPKRSLGTSSISVQHMVSDSLLFYARAVGSGEATDPDSGEVYVSSQLGSMLAQFGRTSLSWGPSFRSNLLLSDNAGTLPLVRFTAELPRVRLTKVVASLERSTGSGSVLLLGTRLDWLATPQFRVGLSEAVVMTWGFPLSVYHLLQPLPVFFSAVASNYLHDVLGQSHNALASVDFDWLVRRGVRFYGELMIDDAFGRLPLKEWRLGLLGGLFLSDPFRTGRTSLRLEYSLVTNGTYSHSGNLEYAYRGRSLGHWLGPDGDDLYLELTHQVDEATTLQISYALTRHGQGFIGQAPPGPQDWLLSGVVERRHTVGFQLHKIYSPSLETRYTLELASIANRGNMVGAQATEGLAAVNITYRWPSAAEAPPSFGQPSLVAEPMPTESAPLSTSGRGRITLQTWSSSVTSRGALSSPTAATFLGATYRTTLGSLPVSVAYDASSQGDQNFWSADLHYPLGKFVHGTVSVLAGWGGILFRGTRGGIPETVSFSGPRVGMDFYYRLTLNDKVTSFYLVGNLSSNIRGYVSPIYLWTYALGAGWHLNGTNVEVGYRGAAALWRLDTPDETRLRWDGLYLSVSFR